MAVAPLAAAVALSLAGSSPPSGHGIAAGTPPSLRASTRWAPGSAGALPFGTEPRSSAPRVASACPIELCPPPSPVAPARPLFRPKRTEIVLAVLARSGVEPVATGAAYLAAFPLRIQWDPPTVEERAGLVHGAGRLGHVNIVLRWRIDARNMPVSVVTR